MRTRGQEVDARFGRARRLPLVALALLTAGAVGLPRQAQAGNADAFYLSGDAALSAGAVTALPSGGGSLWYNPGTLASVSGSRFDVNVSGYAVRFGATADFDSSVPNTEETRLTLVDFDVVPAAVTLTRKFGPIAAGLGVFVPSQSAVILRTQLDAPPDANGNSLQFGYDSSSRYQEYHLGPGIGFNPLPYLGLGASLFVNYRTRVESTDVSATVDTPTSTTSSATHNTLDSQGAGLEMVLGARYRFLEFWSLGFVVRTPAIRLGEAIHTVETSLVADSSGRIEDSISFSQHFGVSTKVLTPFRFHVGLAREIGASVVSADASVLLPFENKVLDFEERTTFNARAGFRTDVSTYWKVGAGVFTDRSQFHEPEQFQQNQLDYYGATIAVDWHRSFGVVSKSGRMLEEPTTMIFGTTVALSYAVGLGEIAGARVGPSPDGGIVFEQNLVDVVAHEITLHIGSTLAER